MSIDYNVQQNQEGSEGINNRTYRKMAIKSGLTVAVLQPVTIVKPVPKS